MARSDWLGSVASTTPLYEITIPGTHDSATYLSSNTMANTQKYDCLTQLQNGIRFLDLRCALWDDALHIVHGETTGFRDMNVLLETVIDQCIQFVAEHPTEFVIVSVKKEDSSDRADFTKAFVDKYLRPNIDCWFYDDRIPQLADVRGKLVLFRRFDLVIDEDWPDPWVGPLGWKMRPFEDIGLDVGGVPVLIQDKYSSSGIEDKMRSVTELVKTARLNYFERPGEMLYVNFTSTTRIPELDPFEFALGTGGLVPPGINERVQALVNDNLGAPLGIVPMDFADYPAWRTVDTLISVNQSISSTWFFNVLNNEDYYWFGNYFLDTTEIFVPENHYVSWIGFIKNPVLTNRISPILHCTNASTGQEVQIFNQTNNDNYFSPLGKFMDGNPLFMPQGYFVKSFQIVATSLPSYRTDNRVAARIGYNVLERGFPIAYVTYSENGGSYFKIGKDLAIDTTWYNYPNWEVRGFQFVKSGGAGFQTDNRAVGKELLREFTP